MCILIAYSHIMYILVAWLQLSYAALLCVGSDGKCWFIQEHMLLLQCDGLCTQNTISLGLKHTYCRNNIHVRCTSHVQVGNVAGKGSL